MSAQLWCHGQVVIAVSVHAASGTHQPLPYLMLGHVRPQTSGVAVAALGADFQSAMSNGQID